MHMYSWIDSVCALTGVHWPMYVNIFFFPSLMGSILVENSQKWMSNFFLPLSNLAMCHTCPWLTVWQDLGKHKIATLYVLYPPQSQYLILTGKTTFCCLLHCSPAYKPFKNNCSSWETTVPQNDFRSAWTKGPYWGNEIPPPCEFTWPLHSIYN